MGECDSMKKAIKWLAVISILVFVIVWGIIGLKILDNDYLFTTEAYIALVSLIVSFICVMYLRITNRCPHCGKMKQPFANYCPHCGKEQN